LGARTLATPSPASACRDTHRGLDARVHHEAASPEKIWVDWGSGVTFVHHSPPNQPLSPNQPRKSQDHHTGKGIAMHSPHAAPICIRNHSRTTSPNPDQIALSQTALNQTST